MNLHYLRHRNSSSIMGINMFNMLCIFGRIYGYGLYIMHDLSLTWDLREMIYDECELLIKCIGIVENDVIKKGFYIVLY